MVRLQNRLVVGASIATSGLVFSNPKFESNTLFCDLVLYCGPFEHSMLPKSLDSVLDWPRSRQHLHLRAQSHKPSAVLRMRSHLIQSVHLLMAREQFCHIQTPCMTSVGLSNQAFEVLPAQNEKYFDKSVYLNESSELHLESMVSGIPLVYTISQTFQAHSQLSRLNAAENLNLEIAKSAGSFEEMMDCVEALCRELTETLSEKYEQSELALILDQRENPNLSKICNRSKPYLRYFITD
jgi:aspartyl/asparaginyl-tRNA synthetase